MFAPGLADDLQAHVPRLAALRPADSLSFDAPESSDWKANWNVVVDNYVECYHCHHAHPALADLFVLAMMPGSHETTTFSGHRYSLGDAPDATRATYLTETLGPEDQRLCESVQQGLKSQSYNQGRFMVDQQRSGVAEHGVHQFHRLVMQALAGA